MDIVLFGAAFAVSLTCALAMGFAIQRGATCTVLAVAEIVNHRRFMRLASMLEASLWVLGGLLAGQALHLLDTLPAGYEVTVLTVAGGVLLGVGAYVNRACVFGAIARLGSGEWAYVATPLGYYAGCVAFGRLRLPMQPTAAHGSLVLGGSGWIAAVFMALLVTRLVIMLRRTHEDRGAGRRTGAVRVWSPHAATIVIGISFFFTLVLVGAWTYTDALAELAHGMASNLDARILLFLGLLGGALLGGWSAGRLRAARPTAAQIARCFIGGALMAWGTLLIPGGNDGLILVGMPLLWPYAWLAFLAMCISIAAAQLIETRFNAARATRERAI